LEWTAHCINMDELEMSFDAHALKKLLNIPTEIIITDSQYVYIFMCTYSGEWRISGGDGIAGAQLTGDRQKCWFVEGVAFGEKQSCVFAAILILEAFEPQFRLHR
jgi:hypothetical protein